MNYGMQKAETYVGPSPGNVAGPAPITELESLLNQLDQVALYLNEDINSLEKTLAPYLRPALQSDTESENTAAPEPLRSPLEHSLAGLLRSYQRIDQRLLEIKSRL